MTTASTPATNEPTRASTGATSVATGQEALELIDVDHVRFYVGNAKQAATFYAHTFGFRVDQISDLTTGSREEASYLLTQGNIRLLLTTGLHPDSDAMREVARYGDGVKDIAFTVADATKAYEAAIENGGESAYEPREQSDELGTVVSAGIKTYGRAVHSFISRSGTYDVDKLRDGGLFAPGFKKIERFALNDYNEKHPCPLPALWQRRRS